MGYFKRLATEIAEREYLASFHNGDAEDADVDADAELDLELQHQAAQASDDQEG